MKNAATNAARQTEREAYIQALACHLDAEVGQEVNFRHYTGSDGTHNRLTRTVTSEDLRDARRLAEGASTRRAELDRGEVVRRIRTQADWIEAFDASLIDAYDLDSAVRQFTANVERALRDARRRAEAQ